MSVLLFTSSMAWHISSVLRQVDPLWSLRAFARAVRCYPRQPRTQIWRGLGLVYLWSSSKPERTGTLDNLLVTAYLAQADDAGQFRIFSVSFSPQALVSLSSPWSSWLPGRLSPNLSYWQVRGRVPVQSLSPKSPKVKSKEREGNLASRLDFYILNYKSLCPYVSHIMSPCYF